MESHFQNADGNVANSETCVILHNWIVTFQRKFLLKLNEESDQVNLVTELVPTERNKAFNSYDNVNEEVRFKSTGM